MAWRFIAQRALTGEWLHWNLPLRDPQLTWSLSGPDALTATLDPEIGGLVAADNRPLFDEWGTLLYAEEEGLIRLGGIVTHSEFDNATWSIEAAGFPAYAKGLPYLDEFQSDSVDPLDVVRKIWQHVQSQPDGDLGVVVDDTTSPVRIGKKPRHVQFTTGEGESVSFEANEAYKLVWWEAKDCGDEIDSLAKQCPFDYHEEHRWIGDQIEHRIRLGYPRLGRRRDDLRFMLGENIAAMPTPERAGDEFANETYAIGKGEGRDAIKIRVPQRDKRLRRCHVFTQSSVGDKDRLRQLAHQDLQLRSPMLQLSEVTVRDHENARLGSWQIGDDIRVQGKLPWIGDLDLWVRVTSYTVSPYAGDAATLTVARSDSFTYGEITT